MVQNMLRVTLLIALSASLVTSVAVAQTSNAQKLVPVIMLLLSGDDCIKPLVVGEVVFDTLEPSCPSVKQGDGVHSGQYATYYSFTHMGGPLHVNLTSDFPGSYDAYLAIRHGEGRAGPLVVSGGSVVGDADGFDDDGYDDYRSSRLVYSMLPAGKYTIEATSYRVSQGAYNLSVYGSKVTAKATGKINDTGFKFAGVSDTTNDADCSNATGDFINQDCSSGRDADLIIGFVDSANSGDGEGGFSFQKVSSTGAPLPASAPTWSCVKDNVTGLMWETKTHKNGTSSESMHDADDSFTWLNSSTATNGGFAGAANGGSCFDTGFCDTSSFASRVNSLGLCGYHDWRVPTVEELTTLLSFHNPNMPALAPLIDTNFFSQAPISHFWTHSSDALDQVMAWSVSFYYGTVGQQNKANTFAIRLVRGTQ